MIKTDKNEYRLDGKLYVKKIKNCVCVENRNGRYFLKCKITERGEKYYRYNPNENRIENQDGKCLYLEKIAVNTVQTAITDYEKEISDIKKAPDIARCDINGDFLLFIRMGNNDTYTHYAEYNSTDNKHYTALYKDISLKDTIWQIRNYSAVLGEEYKAMNESLLTPNQKTIKHNPLYIAAENSKNVLLKHKLAVYYGIATEAECLWLEKITKERILPPLSKEFDNIYVVDCNDTESALLNRSGYKILHTPCFGMSGLTHKKWQLNPHTKIGIDAAKESDNAISFKRYLEMFNGKPIDGK